MKMCSYFSGSENIHQKSAHIIGKQNILKKPAIGKKKKKVNTSIKNINRNYIASIMSVLTLWDPVDCSPPGSLELSLEFSRQGG